MDSDDEKYQDLIKSYQILLENEKRRLSSVTFKNNEEQIEEKIEEKPLETSESDVSQNESDELDKENDDEEISKIVLKKQAIVHEIPQDILKDTKHDTHKRTETMEQWVTDSFYTSFPSFKKQDLQTNTLADDRREEYRKYLAEVSNKKLLDVARGNIRTEKYKNTETIVSKPSEKVQFSARDKLLNDLKHSDLSYNFHNPNAIRDRNQKVAIERTRKKVELQQELIRQIEEKKLQIEKLRAKEREEDEILQRRLENQIKAFQMTDDDITKKNTEKVLTSNPTTQTTRARDPIPRRDLESKNEFYKSEDGSPENRMKNDNDRQIYKFFTNSAPSHNDYNANYYNHPVGLNNMSMMDPRLHHIPTSIQNPAQHCNRCRHAVPILCNTCLRNDPRTSHFCCYRCNLLQNMDVCSNCRRAWVQSWNHNGDMQRYGVNNYQRDNRAQILEITYQEHGSQTSRSTSPHKGDRITRPEFPESNSNSLTHKAQIHAHSPTTQSDKIVGMETITANIPDAVSLSKEQEILELKRKNDILIAKFAQNYGSLRNRKSVSKETKSQSIDDLFPLMREQLTKSTARDADMAKRQQNSQAVSKLEYKWEIPVVQKQLITNNPVKVVTQVGAIAKQLQLEKLNFGNN